MSNIIDSKVKKDEAEGVKKLWTSECEKEEKKSVEIWERKQSWLESYETEYGTGDVFVTEIDSGKQFKNVQNNHQNKRHKQNYTKRIVSDEENLITHPRMPRQKHSKNQRRPFTHAEKGTLTNRVSVHRKGQIRNNFSPADLKDNPNVLNHNGTTYIGRKISTHFLGQRQYDRGGGQQPHLGKM